jgi:hypothetical protein
MRLLTIQLPPHKHVTDEDRREIELKRGKPAEAVCDVTGGLIFDNKNVTTLDNPMRPEFHGKTISTLFLKELFAKIAESQKEEAPIREDLHERHPLHPRRQEF